MGKSLSKFAEAKNDLISYDTFHPNDTSHATQQKLLDFIRLCRANGELEEVVLQGTRLLALQDHDKLQAASTMYLLGNTLRLQLQTVPEQQMAFPDEKERTRAFARAEDLLLRSLDIREEALKADGSSDELKMAVAKTKSALSMIQHSYGGRIDHARAQHESALELFAGFPLLADPDGWVLQKGTWITTKTKLVQTAGVRPVSGIRAIPSSNELSNHHAFDEPVGSLIDDDGVSVNPESANVRGSDGTEESPISKIKWRLVLRPPRLPLDSRTSGVFGRFSTKNGSSFALNGSGGQHSPRATAAALDSPHDLLLQGVLMKINLEHGVRIQVGLPPPGRIDTILGVTHVTIGPKEKFGKILSPLHCTFEEDYSLSAANHDEGSRWVVVCGPKSKGISVNGVKVSRSPLRVGDVIQLGGCSSVTLGSTSLKTRKDPTSIKDAWINGVEYVCERVITTIEDADVGSVVPANLFETTETNDTAFKHFHLLAVSAQMNLNGSPLTVDETGEMFASAVKQGVPFNLWDSWLYAELSRRRMVS